MSSVFLLNKCVRLLYGHRNGINLTLEHSEKVKSLVIVSETQGGFEMKEELPSQALKILQAIEQDYLENVSELQISFWFGGIYLKLG